MSSSRFIVIRFKLKLIPPPEFEGDVKRYAVMKQMALQIQQLNTTHIISVFAGFKLKDRGKRLWIPSKAVLDCFRWRRGRMERNVNLIQGIHDWAISVQE